MASSKALNLLHQHGTVPAHRDDHQNGRQRRYIFHHYFVACCTGGHWDNTEQILAQWQGPAASSVALNMLHQVMPAALHPRVRTAIKMAHNRCAFVHHCQFLLGTTGS